MKIFNNRILLILLMMLMIGQFYIPTLSSQSNKPTQCLIDDVSLGERGWLYYYIIGSIYFFQEDYCSAINVYTQGIQRHPNREHLFLYRGSSHHELQEYETAIGDYTEAIRLKPDFEQAYILRSGTYFELRQIQNTISDLEAAIEINPTNSSSHRILGEVLWRRIEFDKAIGHFELYLELAGEDADEGIRRLVEEWKQ